MKNEYVKETKDITDKTDKEKNRELLASIVRAKREVDDARRNFEYAEGELIDYYSYAIKACQSKLNYLLKMAKMVNIDIDKENKKGLRKYKVM